MDLIDILQKPNNFSSIEIASNWFDKIAQELLNNYNLIVVGEKYRLVEIEFYCYGEEHPDVFTHRDKLQTEFGCWYFHRNSGKYKNGSFKGLDLTCGDGTMYCGILIRSIEKADGKFICGPSLCVDELLTTIQSENLAQLDTKIANRTVWDKDNIIYLNKSEIRKAKIFQSARIGLSLKKAKSSSEMPRYILLPYRYLSEPKLVTKGKIYLILALHNQGISPEDIHQITGSPKHSIKKYIANFEQGQKENDFSIYIGTELNTEKLSQLHGTWYEKFKTEV